MPPQPPTEVETVILRFRDLVTPAGGTIQEHQQFTEGDKSSVWWGWWSKAGERVPSEVLTHLNAKASQGEGLRILLYDSGHNRIYWALCREIKWSQAGEERISSPNPDTTPQYYRDQEYLAWFRLTEIEVCTEAPDSVLSKYAYLRVDDFFQTRSSRYQPFYGKRVASRDELKQQDRTIWFLRPSEPGDPAHEISLLDASYLNPSHFPQDFRQSPSSSLLWLSDLHFSKDGHHHFPLTNSAARKTLAHQLEKALDRLHTTNLAGMILSGDFTWKADSAEYQQAAQSLAEMRSWSKVPEYQIAICPGNHDLVFSEHPEAKGAKVRENPQGAVDGFSAFYENLFYLTPNQYQCSGRRLLLGGLTPVEIVCLNSSCLQQTKHLFQGHGFVGDEQLTHAAAEMGWTLGDQDNHPLRILVLHHHLVPVTFRDEPVLGGIYSAVLDAEALLRWIVRHKIRVVLHGHMHEPYYAKITRPPYFSDPPNSDHTFHVFGMGSTGVEPSHLGEIDKNVFALLKIGRNTLTLEYHSIHPTNESQPIGSPRTITLQEG